MFPRAEDEALLAAVGLKPIPDLGQPRELGPLRHEQHAAAFDLRKCGQPLVHRGQVSASVDDKFELMVVFARQSANDFRLMARGFMPRGPSAREPAP